MSAARWSVRRRALPASGALPASPRRRALLLALVAGVLALVVGAPSPAAADLTLGVFAPAAQFASVQARLELGQRLAEQLESATGGQRIKSRVYARAEDFEGAVRAGAIELALVDATYLARSKGAHTVLAVTPDVAWRLVSTDRFKSVAELRGKRLSLASGAEAIKEVMKVVNGLFEGEAGQLFTEPNIGAAQDSASALAALALGKADAALLPVSQGLPDGVTSLLELARLPGLVLVVYPKVKPDAYPRLAAAAAQFPGDEPVPSLRAANDDVLAAVQQRLAVAPKRAPIPTLPLRALIDALLTTSVFTIPQRPVRDFVLSPREIGQSAASDTAVRPAPPAESSPTGHR